MEHFTAVLDPSPGRKCAAMGLERLFARGPGGAQRGGSTHAAGSLDHLSTPGPFRGCWRSGADGVAPTAVAGAPPRSGSRLLPSCHRHPVGTGPPAPRTVRRPVGETAVQPAGASSGPPRLRSAGAGGPLAGQCPRVAARRTSLVLDPPRHCRVGGPRTGPWARAPGRQWRPPTGPPPTDGRRSIGALVPASRPEPARRRVRVAVARLRPLYVVRSAAPAPLGGGCHPARLWRRGVPPSGAGDRPSRPASAPGRRPVRRAEVRARLEGVGAPALVPSGPAEILVDARAETARGALPRHPRPAGAPSLATGRGLAAPRAGSAEGWQRRELPVPRAAGGATRPTVGK